MSFAIFTDTSANIPTELAEKYNIGVVPLSYFMDGEQRECVDTRSFDAAAYYADMKKGAKITTSQINPQKYVDYMEPTLKDGKDILFIGMAAGISGTLNSARIAREQLLDSYPERKIVIVDSMGASLGEGIWVLYACQWQQDGLTVSEVAEKLEAEKLRMYQLFTVDDLMHLRKGGRLSNTAAAVGTLLQVKPLLKGTDDGKIVSFEKVRGRKAVLNRMVEKYDEMVVNVEQQIVGISHCGCPEDAAAMAESLKQKHTPKEIMIVDHEPVTGSYLGPGALAIYFVGAEDVRKK